MDTAEEAKSSEQKLSLILKVIGEYVDDQMVLADAAAQLQMSIPAFLRLMDSLRVRDRSRCVPDMIHRILRGRQRFLLHLLDQPLLDELERIYAHPVRMEHRDARSDERIVEREVLVGLDLVKLASIGGLSIYHRNLCRL